MQTTTIKYIGRKTGFVDRLHGSGLSFSQGQTRELPVLLADKFLRYTDSFEVATATAKKKGDDTAELLEQANAERTSNQKELDNIQHLHDTVANMDKPALESFAMTHYRQDIDKRLSVERLRQHVSGLIDQYGGSL